MKINLHTHTARCKHATGTIDEYCQAAVDEGISVLGISDHAPLPDNRWLNLRMHMDELDDHLEEIEAARAKYGRLQLLSAMECEWMPAYESWYRDMLLGKYELDYLIGAGHFIPDGEGYHARHECGLQAYTSYLISSMESKLFAFMAHPDAFMAGRQAWGAEEQACSRDILAAAQDLGIPLELNSYGLRKPYIQSDDGLRPPYPYRSFWELAQEYRITYLINSDAHQCSDVWGNYQETVSFVDGLDLKKADMSYLWLSPTE